MLPMQQEVVEAEGHLIDSHLMEQIFDTVVEYNGKFEVEEFRIGRTNADKSYLRLRVETPDEADMQQVLSQLLGLGLQSGRYRQRRSRHGGARLLRPGGFLFHHQPSDPGAVTPASGWRSRTSAWTR